jgi:hypothetical protein
MITIIRDQFNNHRDWLLNTFFRQRFLPTMMRMTQFFGAMAMQQMFIVGNMMDAKHQLETQRLLEELQVKAHTDYQPSSDFCWFGTNVRSMAASEQSGRYNMMALNTRQMARHLGKNNTVGAISGDNDKAARWRQFVTAYCDPQDNAWRPTAAGAGPSGLVLACGTGGGNTKRINLDVNYTRAIEEPKTIQASFRQGVANEPGSTDVVALGNNLYGHDILTRAINEDFLGTDSYKELYMDLRSVAARRNVAEGSYNAIVGMKSEGTSDPAGGANAPLTRHYLAAVMTELGVPPAEAGMIIGQNPSYYAQLEILAKKIYESPDFYANLYDTPANVARKGVALKAIELMLDRAIYESELRQEMLTSVLLSSRLRRQFDQVNPKLPGPKPDSEKGG